MQCRLSTPLSFQFSLQPVCNKDAVSNPEKKQKKHYNYNPSEYYNFGN